MLVAEVCDDLELTSQRLDVGGNGAQSSASQLAVLDGGHAPLRDVHLLSNIGLRQSSARFDHVRCQPRRAYTVAALAAGSMAPSGVIVTSVKARLRPILSRVALTSRSLPITGRWYVIDSCTVVIGP